MSIPEYRLKCEQVQRFAKALEKEEQACMRWKWVTVLAFSAGYVMGRVLTAR